MKSKFSCSVLISFASVLVSTAARAQLQAPSGVDIGNGTVLKKNMNWTYYDTDDAGLTNPAGRFLFEGEGLQVLAPLAGMSSNYRHLYFSAGEGSARNFDAAGDTWAAGTAAGWYRIARAINNGIWNSPQSEVARADALFTIRGDGSWSHQMIRVKAGVMFNDVANASLGLQSQSFYSYNNTPCPFSKVRIVQNSPQAGAWLDVYVQKNTLATFSMMDNVGSLGWVPVAWEAVTTEPAVGTMVRVLNVSGKSSAESGAPVNITALATTTNAFSTTADGKVLVAPQGSLSMGTFTLGAQP